MYVYKKVKTKKPRNRFSLKAAFCYFLQNLSRLTASLMWFILFIFNFCIDYSWLKIFNDIFKKDKNAESTA